MSNVLGPQAGNQVTTRPARSSGYGATQTWHRACSSPTADDGTFTDADMFNDWLAQWLTAFTSSGILVDNGDDMLWRAMQSAGLRYGEDTGTAGALVVAFQPAILTLAHGMPALVKFKNDLPGACTLKADGTAAKSLKRADGTTDPQSGDVKANMTGLIVYDAIMGVWKLLTVLPAAGAANASASAPFYPEALTVDGKLAITANVGSVVIGAAQAFQYRGMTKIATDSFVLADRTLATAASKTYHLRWHASGTGDATPSSTYPNGRFVLKDLANAGYNPASLAEVDASFDTTFDNMLIARVVTDGGNTPTVIALVNRADLLASINLEQTFTRTANGMGAFVAPFTPTTLNWSRTPKYAGSVSRAACPTGLSVPPEEAELYFAGSVVDGSGTATASMSRYAAAPVGYSDLNAANGGVTWTFGYQLSLMLKA